MFNIANINMNTSAYISEQIDAVREMQSLFVTAQVGFRDYLFLDVSARNDWSSTLAYTTRESRGFSIRPLVFLVGEPGAEITRTGDEW